MCTAAYYLCVGSSVWCVGLVISVFVGSNALRWSYFSVGSSMRYFCVRVAVHSDLCYLCVGSIVQCSVQPVCG